MGLNNVTNSLDDNITYLKAVFQDSDDIVWYSFRTLAQQSGLLLYSAVTVDIQYISQTVLPQISLINRSPDANSRNSFADLLSLTGQNSRDWKTIIPGIAAGQSLILVDGFSEGFLAETSDIQARRVDKPDTEALVRGPLEAFVERLPANLSLIRNRFKSSALKINYYTLGESSQTSVALVYIDQKADPEVLQEIRRRLTSTGLASIQDSAYLSEFLVKQTLTPFPLIQSTERPDKVVACLEHGQIAVLVDGSPFALMLPTIFLGFFQTPEDYYQHFLIGSIIRWLRLVGFWLGISLPSLYIAATLFHPEMVPLRLLFSLSAAREFVPISTIAEVLAMLLVLDLFREATLRLPRTIGQAIGIVGALVMGQAAVAAGAISPIMVIILALTAVATFAVPTEEMRGTVRILSYVLVACSGFLGLYGYLLGLSAIFLHVSSLESLGVPYLSSFGTVHTKEWNDVLVRAPWHVLKSKPQILESQESSPPRRK